MTKNKWVNLLLEAIGCFISALGIYSFAVAAGVPVEAEPVTLARKLIGEVGCGMPEALFLALHTVSEHLREIEEGGGTDDEA